MAKRGLEGIDCQRRILENPSYPLKLCAGQDRLWSEVFIGRMDARRYFAYAARGHGTFLTMDKKQITPPLAHEELLQLKRWNTPTIYNGWEQLTRHDPAQVGINPEATTDFMPQMGPMVGWAVTVRIEPSQPRHKEDGSRRTEA